MKNFAKGCSVRTIRSFGNFEINPLRFINSVIIHYCRKNTTF